MSLLTAVVLACTGVLVWSNHQLPDDYGVLRASFAGPTTRPLLVVAFQQGDCEKNLDFLAVLQRPEFASRVDVLALFSGARGEFRNLSKLLEARHPNVRFQLLQGRERRLLSMLGHPSTPYWVLLDTSGAVRLSAPAPPDPRAYSVFAASLRMNLPPVVRA